MVQARTHQFIYFQHIPSDWKSDPLDRAGAEGDPTKATQVFCFFGVALRTRYKRDLHRQPRVTTPKNVDYGKYITRNVTI